MIRASLCCLLLVPLAAQTAPKPLFVDPNYHGSCDPEAIWITERGEVWIYYTARRSTREQATYVGTPIGVIASKNLIDWEFKGYATFDGVPGEKDMPVTFWAPGVIRRGDTLHMFVTYKDNAEPPWGGKGVIRHNIAPVSDPHKGLSVYRSQDGITWKQSRTILENPGTGPQDGSLGRHPSVLVRDGRAFLFYHVEPERPYPTPPAEKRTIQMKKSVLQVAELRILDGQLVCDRDDPVNP